MLRDVQDGKIKNIRDYFTQGGVDLDMKDEEHGFTALHIVCISGHVELCDFLLHEGAQVNAQDKSGSTPLHKASINGHLELISKLLSSGAEINAKENNGSTPLHHACIYGHVGVVSLLLDHGAEILQDNCGHSPLHHGCMKGITEIVSLLLDKQVQVDEVDSIDLMAPLHYACLFRHIAVVSLLLDKDAAINIQDKNGDSPLHLASQSGSSEIVSLLLQRGANVLLKNQKGKTALDQAKLGNDSDCIDLLKRAQSEKETEESQIQEGMALELQCLRSENEFLRKELLTMKEKRKWEEKEILNGLKRKNDEILTLRSQLSKMVSPDLRPQKSLNEEQLVLPLGTSRIAEKLEKKNEDLSSLKVASALGSLVTPPSREEKVMSSIDIETQLLECQLAIKDLKTQLDSKDLLLATEGGLDINLYRDLQELKITIRLSPKRQAASSNILIEDPTKPVTDPLKLLDLSSKATSTVDPSSPQLSEELNSKVKLLISRLEIRERELVLKHDFDAAKLCQLSRRSFVQHVEMFCGESIGNRKDREAVLISEIHTSRDGNLRSGSAIGSG